MLLVTASAALMCGMALSLVWKVDAAGALLIALALAALALLLRLRDAPRASLAVVAAACVFLALARAQETPVRSVSEGLVRALAGKQAVINGRVVRDPERMGNVYRLRVRGSLTVAGAHQPMQGDVLVTLRPWQELAAARADAALKYGDRLRLEGALSPAPRENDATYGDYLAREGVAGAMFYPKASLLGEGGSLFYRSVYGVRRALADALGKALPEPQAALGQAVLLGLRRELPQDVNDAFARTGMTHLLAISGMNVGMVLVMLIALAEAALGRRWWVALLPLAGLGAYTFVSGADPPVVRASIMGALALWARAEGRPASGVIALALAGTIMVVVTPPLLLSVSFQLSFAAMLGLVTLAPPLQQWVEGRVGEAVLSAWPVRWVVIAFSAGVAATLLVLPITAFYFGRVSLVGVPLTVVALPALPLIIAASALAALAGLAWHPLGAVAGWVAWVPMTYMLKVVELGARVPGASVEMGRVAGLLVWVYYGIVAATFAAVWRSRAARPHAPQAGGAGAVATQRARPMAWRLGPVPWRLSALALGVAAALLWSAAYLTPPRGVLRVAVLDVGQGDAILVTSPSGRQVLVDGGPDPAATLRALGRHVPFWDKTLDIVVLTHPDADHVGGLAGVVGRYRPGLVLERRSADTVVAQQWERAASNSKARRVVAEAGQRISLGDGAALEVLWPSASWADAPAVADNNAGVVLRVTYGQAAVLLAADIEAPAERALVASGTTLQAQALKVPHHGSRTSTSPALLEAAAPLVAVISAGRDNRFGHPHAEVVERLVQAINVGGVVSTAERGDVVFTTDGARLWIATQR